MLSACASLRQKLDKKLQVILLDALEKSLGAQFVRGIFNGEETTTTTFPGGVSEVKHPTTLIELQVTRNCSLQQLVDAYQKPEKVDDFYDGNADTHHEIAIVHRRIAWPRAVGFVFGQYSGKKYAVELPESFEGRKLVSVVMHCGSLHGGHYEALRRHPDLGTWYCCNDARVTCWPTGRPPESEEYYIAFFV